MRRTKFFTGIVSALLLAGAAFALSSCDKIEELLGEDEEDLDLMDNEAVTCVLDGGIWYKYPNYAYLFRKDRTMVSSWYDFVKDPTDPGDMPVGTNAYPLWEVEDGYLYLDEDHSGRMSLDQLLDFDNYVLALQRMYDPAADKGTLEVPALTGQVWSGNYFMSGMDGSINTSLQFFDDGTALRVDSVYAGYYEIGRLDRYEYRWEVSDNVIRLTGEDSAYGVALPDVAGGEPGVGKAIYMDFGRVGSPYVNVSF